MSGDFAWWACDVFLAFAVAPALGRMWARLLGGWPPFTLYWFVGDTGGMVSALLHRAAGGALICGAGAAAALLWDWWNRKGRQVGEKGREVIARLVERARGTGMPAPQGVPG